MQTIAGSSGQPGIRIGAEPVATITLSAVTSCSPPSAAVTTTRPGPSNRAVPASCVTARPLNKLAMPPRSWRIVLSLWAVIAFQSKPTSPATFTPHLSACLHRVQHFGRRQQRLRRNAAVVEAGAAEVMLLDDGDARAELGRLQRRDVAAGAGADHQELIVVRHVRPTLSLGCSRIACSRCMNFAAITPSTMRWSALSVIVMLRPARIAPFSTITDSRAALTARMPDSGGLMIALNSSTPNMPRLLIVKWPLPMFSSRPLRACSTTRFVSAASSAERQRVDVGHDRHDEPIVDADRDADVGVRILDDFVADDLAPHGRKLADRPADGQDDRCR